ncbi:MAG: hypothetical protein GX157_00220, partial [Candidatus Cloacimonetes bacterium]|nr:hypothetical protein [Candidatus Cloacimonadota bacterium]
MKKRFVILRGFLAVSLCMMLPSVALAADWDVSTSDDVAEAYTNDTDATVNIFMMDSIAMDSMLYGNAGQGYTINGKGYVISDLILSGAGSTTVNADVED